MNDIKHKIGDTVIALDSSIDELQQFRIKGNSYKVLDIRYCAKCGIQVINITIATSAYNHTTCVCGFISTDSNKWWTKSSLFAPITKDFLKKMEEEEDYILCALIRDHLAEQK
jgi:hypothetical protein